MRLYTKLFLSVVPAAALSGAAIIAYSRRAVHAALLAEVRDIALQAGLRRSPGVAAGLESADELRLLPELQSLQRATSARYAAALDVAGKTIAHTDVGEVSRLRRDPGTLAALSSKRPSAREAQAAGAPTLDLFIPVFATPMPKTGEEFLVSGGALPQETRRLGTLLVGLALTDILKTERRIDAAIWRIVLAFNGLTIAAALFFMRGISAPLRRLQAMTARIRQGDYGVVVPAASGDEIGALARSFNEMSRTLAKTVPKDFFNNVLDRIRDQLIVTGADGIISLVNPSVVVLLGYAPDEIIGRPASMLFDPDSGFFGESSLARLDKDGSPRNARANFVAKTGEKIPILLSISPLKGEDGRITGFIGSAKDISDLMRLEARMQQSEKLSAVGQLAAGVAHEINNPLAVILGFSQGMSRALKPGDSLELPIRSIEREARRCKALVQDLLTFSRASRPALDPLDLNESVSQTLALVRAQAKLTSVRVEASLAAGLPLILGNMNQIEQVILNLAKNALDAMPGGGCLTLTSELLNSPPHSWVCLRIADTGAGIPPALKDRIFEPFFTTKPVGRGTGLGLSLVNEIVKRHSGEIEVQSEPGKTVFTVKFPARTGEELEAHMKMLQQERLGGTARESPRG